MSGRYTFSSGAVLTAAQLNTNVMDGIPFKIVANNASVTGSLAVTFASAFTTGITPTVIATLRSTTSAGTSVTTGTPTATGVTFYVWAGTIAGAVARTVDFIAFQMTPSSGVGNS